MESDKAARRRRRSAIRRAWLHCLLLALPALVLGAVWMYQSRIGLAPALMLGGCLLLYLLLVAAALIEGLVRPLQTLSNVVSSLREGDYSFRARGAQAPDSLGELAAEVNALADLLQRQRVRSLEATALLARILEVMHAPLFAFDREDTLQLVNNAGLKLLGLPNARCFGRGAKDLGLEELLRAPDQSIHSFHENGKAQTGMARWMLRKANFRQEGAPHTLLLLADVSVPLQEEEKTAWKRLIRVLGHELSNSLAPIKSIAGSLLERLLSVELDQGAAVQVNADPDQLEQMFINLLANAVDASLSRGSQTVRMGWKVDAGSVVVTIEDRGLGIANAENLFVPFYTTKPSGSGVGLALAQQIARAHGGDVQLVNREDGEGARASIRLPSA